MRGLARALALLSVLRLALLPALIVFSPVAARAATYTAASCNFSAVQSALNMALSGDTVIIPAGSCTWTSNLSLTAAITLQGAGIGVTIITHNVTGSQDALIQFNGPGSGTVRITGIDFQGLDYNHRAIKCSGSGYTNSPFRIDNSHFLANGPGGGGSPAGLIDNFSCAGLVDHDTFDGTGFSELIHNNGDGDAGWTNNVVIGGANMLFVEDNTFNTTSGGFVSAIESYAGSRLTFRHNTLNSAQVDEHGTAGYVGARWWEIYSNTFNTSSSYSQDKTMDLRGGSGLAYNNTRTGPLSVGIVVREEDSTTWPAAYQVGSGINGNTNGHVTCGGGTLNNSPAYFWNNGAMGVSNGAGTSTKVNLNEDYFVSGSAPATISAEQLSTDTCSTTYTYTPYTYPHPLQGPGVPSISPAAGSYTSPQTISISDSDGSATICYTTDGSSPAAATPGTCSHGSTYSSSFSQSIPVTVKALATRSGFTNSSIASNAYTLSGGGSNVPGAGTPCSACVVSNRSPQWP